MREKLLNLILIGLLAVSWLPITSALASSATFPWAVRLPSVADTWSALPNHGLNGGVLSLAVIGSDLYAGGAFTQTSDGTVTNLNHIARYHAGVWLPLAHAGLNGIVYSLAVIGSDLYVGGSFTQSADATLTNLKTVASYNTVTGVWSALAHNGLNNVVRALAVMGNDLVAGGDFSQAADGAVTNLNLIARYSAGAWLPFANTGLSNPGGSSGTAGVYAIAVTGSNLYVGGTFNQTADGTLKNLNNIALFAGGGWAALTHAGLNETYVLALAMSGSDLYIGGIFTQTSDGVVTGLNNIARYHTLTSTWSGLAHTGLNQFVYALSVNGSSLYVGGNFIRTADNGVTNLNTIASYDTATDTWSALANNGLDGTYVFAFAEMGNRLYTGGFFGETFDKTVTNLNDIARLDRPVVTGPIHAYLPAVTR